MQPRRVPLLTSRPQPPPPLSPSANGRRPLSDIRETTEPNLIDAANRRGISFPSPRRAETPDSHHIPENRIPPRSSSRRRNAENLRPGIAHKRSDESHIHNKNQQRSPVKEAAERLCPSGPPIRRPSKTHNKIQDVKASHNLVDHPFHSHHRITLELEQSAPLFVGGSSVEGHLRIVVDGAESHRRRKPLRLQSISVDVLGVEEILHRVQRSVDRRHVFMHRSNSLVDPEHPPPLVMRDGDLDSQTSWHLTPCRAALPFLIALSLEIGPPPFKSRHAQIRYLLCATMYIIDNGRPLCVRVSQQTSLLSVYDRAWCSIRM